MALTNPADRIWRAALCCAAKDVAKRKEKDRGRADERVFVKDGFRSYRRTYRLSEVYWGAATFAVLLGVVGWVSWKGANPDPSLFDMSAAISGEPSTSEAPLPAPRAAPARERPSSEAKVEDSPLPPGLGAGGFRQGKLGRFSSDDLYVKINGRAGFFQSFGVKSLHALTLEAEPAAEAGGASIDIELYDLGETQNAIGAYNGEKPPELTANMESGSTFHVDRNAAFLARGRYYVRFIGSDESEAVKREVSRLLELFRKELPAEELPWAYALFVDQLKLSAERVKYMKANAFSFGFASDVYSVTVSPPDARDDVEVFVTVAAGADAARALAAKYEEGFSSLGVAAGKTASGVRLFKDEFLNTLSAATAADRWVIGMRGAAKPDEVEQMLARLAAGLRALPPEVHERAVPVAAPAEVIDEH